MGQHPNSLANLKKFEPGNPGGPGRPPRRPLSEAYDDILRSALPDRERKLLGLPKGVTWAEAIAEARARAALRKAGVLDAKEIADRVEGKATQRIEISASEDRVPQFVVIYAAGIPGVRPEPPEPIDVTPQPAIEDSEENKNES